MPRPFAFVALGVALVAAGAATSPTGRAAAPVPATAPVERLPRVGILPTAPSELFTVQVGEKVFADRDAVIQSIALEVAGLLGVRFTARDAKVELETRAPVQLLIGCFRSDNPEFAKPPGATPAIKNAATITNMPPVDIYVIPFEKGKRLVPLQGTYVILGVIPGGITITSRDANGGTTK
jgi:hypothetical protein